MARPEGDRKARRLVELAGRFGLPVLTFVDTSGAFPGIEAEARGQAEAIARSIEAFLEAPVPIVATIVGEGGSGGAMALAAGDRIMMLEYAIYSVASPEACASILWRDAAQASVAAEALRLTADDLQRLKLIDQIIPEPLGGAQRDKPAALQSVSQAIQEALASLSGMDGATLRAKRRDKFLAMGHETVG
jgi:acetyl-CoA carboxylase carboxyl transferase subunit alpha